MNYDDSPEWAAAKLFICRCHMEVALALLIYGVSVRATIPTSEAQFLYQSKWFPAQSNDRRFNVFKMSSRTYKREKILFRVCTAAYRVTDLAT